MLGLRNNSCILFCMRNLFLLFCCILSFANNALASVFSGDRVIYNDLFIDKGEYYKPDTLSVLESIKIENNGLIETNIVVRDGVQLNLENHAIVNSVFVLGNGASIVQHVSDVADMNKIDFNVPYSVMVDGANMLSLFDVIGFAKGADKIILGDSWFDIQGMGVGNDISIELNGNVFLYADNIDGLYDLPFITGVHGNGMIYLITDNHDLLFVDVAVLNDGKLYFERRRELDYQKVFNDKKGVFLNLLRRNNHNDKLLYALDSVGDMDSFNHVLNQSARFNDDILLRPLRILNAVNTQNYFDGVSAGGWAVLSDDFYSVGINALMLENVLSGLELGIGVSAGKIEYDGLYDAYSGDLLGVDLFAIWNVTGDIVLRGRSGVLYENADIGDVFYDNKVYENPNPFLGYVQSDVVYDYNLFDSLKLSVYLGAKTEIYSVVDVSGYNLNLYSGMGAKYKFESLGIKYEYAIGVEINSDSDVMLNAAVGFVSDMDMIGGSMNFTAIRMFDVMTYKISLGAQLLF